MLEIYQKRIDTILKQYEKPYWDPLSQLARLAEEVGEVGRILNHRFGDKPKKPTEAPDDLEEELADVQKYIKSQGVNPGTFGVWDNLVAPPRLELGTQGSSGLCSTN